MGALWALFSPPAEERALLKGSDRIINVFRLHFRGIFGFIVPFILLPFGSKEHYKIVSCVWAWMFWSFLIQPVGVPVVGFIPIFIFPLTCVLDSATLCNSIFNENVGLFIVGGWLLMLLNNSDFDRRVMLFFLNGGNFSVTSTVIRGSVAAFILSIFSHRLITTSRLMSYLTENITDKGNEKARTIVCCAVHTSSTIGSIVVVHCNVHILTVKAIFTDLGYVDIFNYLQYTLYALPVALIMFALNLAYFGLLAHSQCQGVVLEPLISSIPQNKSNLSKPMALHETLSLVFVVVTLFLHFTRFNLLMKELAWTYWIKIYVHDSTIAAVFVIFLHVLPCKYDFFKIFTAKKKSELPPCKPMSAVLWWRFIDKNSNYAYIFVMGAATVLNRVVLLSGLGHRLSTGVLHFFGQMHYILGLALISFVSVLLCNIMSPLAATLMLLPLVNGMNFTIWTNQAHILMLAIGMGTSISLVCPFRYTPAFFTHYNGMIPKLKMARICVVSAVICWVVLWLSLFVWAPVAFGWSHTLVPKSFAGPTTTTTTTTPPPT